MQVDIVIRQERSRVAGPLPLVIIPVVSREVLDPTLPAPANWAFKIKRATSISKKLHELRPTEVLDPRALEL